MMRTEAYIKESMRIFSLLGIARKPQDADYAYLEKWAALGMEQAAVTAAAEALKKAASVLKSQGYDSDWFAERYAKDVLIGDYYSQIRKGADVFGRTVKIRDSKKLRIKLEDAVAAGLLLGERAYSIGCLN